jgi:hypothetical protein
MVSVAWGSLVNIESLMPQGVPEARLEGWSRLNAIAARPFVARWNALRGRSAALRARFRPSVEMFHVKQADA